MGNCCSDVAGSQSAVGGTASYPTSSAVNAPNEAVEAFLNSRGYQGLYSQIEHGKRSERELLKHFAHYVN